MTLYLVVEKGVVPYSHLSLILLNWTPDYLIKNTLQKCEKFENVRFEMYENVRKGAKTPNSKYPRGWLVTWKLSNMKPKLFPMQKDIRGMGNGMEQETPLLPSPYIPSHSPPPPPRLTYLGSAFTCYRERRKTRREGREVANSVVVASWWGRGTGIEPF